MIDHPACQTASLAALFASWTGALPPVIGCLAAGATLFYYLILIVKELRKK